MARNFFVSCLTCEYERPHTTDRAHMAWIGIRRLLNRIVPAQGKNAKPLDAAVPRRDGSAFLWYCPHGPKTLSVHEMLENVRADTSGQPSPMKGKMNIAKPVEPSCRECQSRPRQRSLSTSEWARKIALGICLLAGSVASSLAGYTIDSHVETAAGPITTHGPFTIWTSPGVLSGSQSKFLCGPVF